MYNEQLKNIPATASTYGHSIKVDITGLFTSSTDESISIIEVGSPSTVVKGKITNGCLLHANNILEAHDVANAKITFMQNTMIDSPNNIIYDYTYANQFGEYTAYLEPGEYKVRIDTPRKYFFFNQVVTTGIKEHYFYPESTAIKEKIKDTTVLYGTDKVLVSGCLLSETNAPFPGQIIISQNNELVAFINTLNGKYNFLIDYGIYDIRIRAIHRSIQIHQNFNFQPGKGFFSELSNNRIDRNNFYVDTFLNRSLPPRKYNQYTF